LEAIKPTPLWESPIIMIIAYHQKEDYLVIPNDLLPAGIIQCIIRTTRLNLHELMLVNLNDYD
jgi:hypothetical protein